ncbi:MAG: hypothetical protein R2761_13015 [Acidimicrobiales bacterium]
MSQGGPVNLIPYYAAYVASALVITIWLARTLFSNGAVFLADTFDGRPELASAVNRLLVTGFFMLNLGYALWLFHLDSSVDTATEAVEALSTYLGVLLVSLAVVHFVNLVVFNRIRAHSRSNLVPPLPPGDLVAPPPPAPMPPTMPPAPRVAVAPILPAP